MHHKRHWLWQQNMIDSTMVDYHEMNLMRTTHPTILKHVELLAGECWWREVFFHRGDVSAAKNTVQ